MIEQQGQVVGLRQGNAYVRVGSTSGCPTCESGKGCGGGIFARLVPKQPVTLEVSLSTDSPRLAVGQQVMLGIPDVFFLRWTGILFGIPLLAGLAMASVAQWARNNWVAQLSAFATDLLVLVIAVLAAAISLWFIRRWTALKIHPAGQLYVLEVLPPVSCGNKA